MKIGFIIPHVSGYGGIERVVASLANYFQRNGNTVVLVFLSKRFGYDVEGKIIEYGTKLPKTKIGRLLSSIHSAIKLKKTFREENFDVIYNLFWLVPLVFFSYRKRIVTALHSDPRNAPFIFGLFIKYLFPLSKYVVVVSSSIRIFMMEKYRIKNVVTIYNPIDMIAIDELSHLPVSDNIKSPYILAAGRLASEKNFGLLIEAFSKLPFKDRVSLVIIGEGDQRSELEKIIKEKGLTENIALPGLRKNPFVLMKNCLFFVCSSITEAFPMVLVEALACGSPVISTFWSSADEIVKDGENGLLVKNNDLWDLKEGMEKMFVDINLHTLCKSKARLSVETFAISNIAREYENLFLKVVGDCRKDI